MAHRFGAAGTTSTDRTLFVMCDQLSDAFLHIHFTQYNCGDWWLDNNVGAKKSPVTGESGAVHGTEFICSASGAVHGAETWISHPSLMFFIGLLQLNGRTHLGSGKPASLSNLFSVQSQTDRFVIDSSLD